MTSKIQDNPTSFMTIDPPSYGSDNTGEGIVFNSVVDWYRQGAIVVLYLQETGFFFHNCQECSTSSEEDYFARHWTIYVDFAYQPQRLITQTGWVKKMQEASCSICTCKLGEKASEVASLPNSYTIRLPHHQD